MDAPARDDVQQQSPAAAGVAAEPTPRPGRAQPEDWSVVTPAPAMRLALFDFDGTLTTRDSLMPFLRHAVGPRRFAAGLLACSGPLLAFAAGRIANDAAKQAVLAQFLRGRSMADVRSLGAAFATGPLQRLLRPAMLQALRGHQAAGDSCVLVSASLDVYLQPWASAQGFDALLCSRLALGADGCVSGSIEPRNCHGAEKARRIAEWLAGRQPSHVTAYGDSRGDHEMLQLADVAHWLGAARRRPASALAFARARAQQRDGAPPASGRDAAAGR